ncbi:hypothetical protein B0A48_07094 [Cryoendolithus antarcticus]|uniref:Peptidase metallopeptidase domain-containing protein n=1 Tax=Cryoendolithus antarcticus TaxID=1507870 RepID=A0A1V8T7L1_9PEZI|nr:hypothetical protein B0A48_07094 [Cryoendolithus antarcticus]
MGREVVFRNSGEDTKNDRIEALITEIVKRLGEAQIAVLDPAKDGPKDDEEELKAAQAASKEKVDLSEVPACQSQPALPKNLQGLDDQAHALDLWIGTWGRIPRWKRGVEINFAAYSGGYPKLEDAVYAARQLNCAALYWNSLEVGVTFKWVGRLADAEFVLGYGGDQGNTVARAFFPNANDLNNLFVYKRAFDSDTKPAMWRFFLHELGHVLGLRHEFARIEGGAVQWGNDDPLSVMNYRKEAAPMITEQDIASTRAFYNYNEATINGVPVQLFVPDN